jgi:excisionase family DNA binding protein
MSAMQQITTANAEPFKGPMPFVPLLLSARNAALYLGISETNFVDRVRTGELPQPRRIGNRVLWHRHTLDQYAAALFGLDDEDSGEVNFFGD